MGIKNNLPIQQALENEEQFLSANYPTIARQNGVPHLKRKLHDLLMAMNVFQTATVKLILETHKEMHANTEQANCGENKRL